MAIWNFSQSGAELKIQDGQQWEDWCGFFTILLQTGVVSLSLTDIMECTDHKLCKALDGFELLLC